MSRKFLPTLVILLVFAAGAIYLLVDQPKTKDERDEAALTVVKADRDNIDRIDVTNQDGTLHFTKAGDGWTFTVGSAGGATAAAPKTYRVEETEQNQMLNALSSLVATTVVWEKPADADKQQTGLAPAPLTAKVVFHAADGDHELDVGRATMKDDAYYVTSPARPSIFVARKYSVEVFGKAAQDFRRKKMLEFDRDDVRAVTIDEKGKGAPMVMTRVDALAPWKVTSPFVGRADRGTVNGLLSKLESLRAESFVDTVTPETGLNDPQVRILLTLADGKMHTILVGAEKRDAAPTPASGPSKTLYVQEVEGGQTALVSATIGEELTKPFDDWRDKSLYDFVVDDVSALDLKVDGKQIAAARDDAKMWKTSAPVAGNVVNPEATAFLRSAKEATRVKSGDAAPDGSAAAHRYGFDRPALAASWTTPLQKMTLVVGNPEPGTNGRWVRTEESPVAQLVASDLLAPAKSLAEIAAKPLVTSTAGGATTATKSTAGTTTLTIKNGT